MKKTVRTVSNPSSIAHDIRLVSTHWQIEELRRQGRNQNGIAQRTETAALESYAAHFVRAKTAGTALCLHFLRNILDSMPVGKYQSIKRTRGFERALLDWIRTVLAERIPVDELEKTHGDLLPVMRAFLSFLEENGRMTVETALSEAAKKARERKGMRYLVTGFHDFRCIELDFLDALAEHNEVTLCLTEYEQTPFTKLRRTRLKERGWEFHADPTKCIPEKASLYTAATEMLLARTVLKEAAVFDAQTVDLVVPTPAWAESLLTEADAMDIPVRRALSVSAASTGIGRDALRLAERMEKEEPAEDAAKDLPSFREQDLPQQTPVPDLLRFSVQRYLSDRWCETSEDTRVLQREVQGAQAVLDAVDEWEQLKADGSFSMYLRDALEEAVPATPGPTGGIRVLRLSEAAGLHADLRIFTGFDGTVPQTSAPNFLLSNRADDAAPLTGVPLYYKEKLRLQEAFSRADQVRLALVQNEKNVSVSPLFRSRVGAHLLRTATRIPEADALLTPTEWDMRRAYQGETDAVSRPTAAFLENQTRTSKTPIPRDIPVVYSASALDTYTRCPFRYWLKYRIRPEEVAGPAADIGRLMHDVLRIYYDENKNRINTALDAKITPEVSQQEVEELFDRAAKDIGRSVQKEYRDQLCEQLVSYIRMDMQRLLDSSGYRVGETEAAFQFSLTKRIGLTGRMDRLDRRPGSPDWIVDYKTGGLPTKGRIENLEEFQLPLYSLQQDPPAHVYYGGLRDTKFQAVQMPEDYAGKSQFSSDRWAQLLEQAKTQIHRIDAEIRNGIFPVTPSEAACKYCPYAPVCRREELE